MVGFSTPPHERVEQARTWMRGSVNLIQARKLWPSGVASWRGKITGADDGRAIAFADDPAWPEVVAEVRSRRAGPASTAGALHVLGQWRNQWASRPTVVVALPGPDGGTYAAALAAAIGQAGKLPTLEALVWSGDPVASDTASGARVAELTSRLALAPDARISGTVLLVAATYRSGWTTTLAAALLRSAGADRVLPLVAQQLP